MLSTLVILVQEFLEASLLISLLALSYSGRYRLGLPYKLIAILSLTGAVIYASSLRAITQWFDGMGQEWTNGTMLVIMVVTIALYLYSLVIKHNYLSGFTAGLTILLSVTREGAEVMLYLNGILMNPNAAVSSLMVGSVIGAGLGVCIGVLAYYSLVSLPERVTEKVVVLFLILMAAGLSAETLQVFMQAGVVNAGLPVWDTGFLISERSIAGQLLHAVFSYEASPTRVELTAWLMVFLMLCSIYFGLGLYKSDGE